MKSLLPVIGLAITLQAVSAPSLAIADGYPQTRQEKLAKERRDRLNEKYQATGKERRCISYSQIRDTQVIDDYTIFFQVAGRKGYVNDLRRKCPRLMYEERFAYRSHTGQLCRGEVITVLDNFGQNWASCSLGDFKEYMRKPKQEKDEKEN